MKQGPRLRAAPARSRLIFALLAAIAPAGAAAQPAADGCSVARIERLGRNPTPGELRCRYGIRGPGPFGLLSYLDIPVYRPLTPLPGTHLVGVPGMPHPAPRESYERWEWRLLRALPSNDVRTVHNQGELLDPVFASRLRRFERLLAERGVYARRRETWRSPERQAWLFQQGRSRPGAIVTTTLTSWHNRVDRAGRPAARAADYDVSGSMPRFHATAAEVGLESYGADSFDPGHVFWPDEDAARGAELAVLRLLPRVQHVTLATGRPEGEAITPDARRRWQLLSQEFVAAAFQPLPDLLVALAPRRFEVSRRVAPPPPAPAPEPRRGRRRRG